MAVRTPYTPLYGDVLDYLERSGLPSVGGIFDDYDESKNPFIIDFEESTSSDDLDKTDLPLVQATRGGGGDFSVYNPDPTRTRTSDEYSPYAYNRAMRDTGKFGQTVGPNPDLFYPSPLTGIPGLAADFFKNSLVGKGIASLEDMLPVNTRAILENEALGAGIALDDIGRIVQGSGDYDSAANVMAGYNLNKITPETIQKRRETIEKTMSKPGYSGNLQERLDALDDFERQMFGTTGVKSRADMITEQRLIEEDPSLEGPDYLRNAFNFYEPSFLKQEQQKAIEAATADSIARKKAAAEAEKRRIEAEAVKARQEELRKRQEAADRSRQQYDPGNIGGGSYRSDRDNTGDGGYGGDSKRSEDNRSSDLGFSDIRLKENVELIGKSPSNINIYKFNYKDNPTTYQGAMAHEVPWASVKHSNGYMMVDYNQIDVEFKKI